MPPHDRRSHSHLESRVFNVCSHVGYTPDHYVLPVEDIKEGQELRDAFEWLAGHESEIRSYYDSHLADYISGIDKDILNVRL